MIFNISACATVKNEAPYLEEWLRYHSLQGVEHFYIHDDESTDGTLDILKEWEAAGKATIYTGFRKPNVPPQKAFYDFIAKEKKDETKWCAFLDIDEFYHGEKTMNELLSSLNDNVSAMEIGWCHYGSDGLLENDGRLVIERFLKHSDSSFYRNWYPKTIAKLANVVKCSNVHIFEYSRGIILNSDLKDITQNDFNKRLNRIDSRWTVCRINHYYVKSLAEYHEKMKKGYADSVARRPYQFRLHNLNTHYDASMLKWVEPIKNFKM